VAAGLAGVKLSGVPESPWLGWAAVAWDVSVPVAGALGALEALAGAMVAVVAAATAGATSAPGGR
jgi:hypothetical protein